MWMTWHLEKLNSISHCDSHASRGRTYVMITYVSKENNLGPDDTIRYKGPIFIFVNRSWSALTSYIHIKCYRFMK